MIAKSSLMHKSTRGVVGVRGAAVHVHVHANRQTGLQTSSSTSSSFCSTTLHEQQQQQRSKVKTLAATGSDEDMKVMDDELSRQLERLRIAERDNMELKKQIDELESELNIDFELLSMAEEVATLSENKSSSLTSGGPSLPQLDVSDVAGEEVEVVDSLISHGDKIIPAAAEEAEDKGVAAAAPTMQVAAEEEEENIPIDAIQEDFTPVEAVQEEEEEEEIAMPAAPEAVKEEEVKVEKKEEDADSAVDSAVDSPSRATLLPTYVPVTELPKAGKLWSLVPKATLRIGKNGVTADALKTFVEQLEQSESNLVKVQLFNKQLELLDVVNDILKENPGVSVVESKGRSLLFGK